jgi:hypothetical protein
MGTRAKWIITTAALLVLGGALIPPAVANEWGSFRSCESDRVLYDPSTDDIAVYYSPLGKYIVFPLEGQIRYLGRPKTPDYSAITSYESVNGQWRIDTANKVKELRATGRCKTTAGG